MAENWQLKAVLSANSAGMVSALKSVNTMAKSTRKYLGDVASSAGNLSGKLGLTGMVGFAAVFYGATRAAGAALNYAGAIQDATDRTGAGVESYQSLVSMIESVGGTAEDGEMAFKKFGIGISAAARGKDASFGALLERMGVRMRDTKGQLIGLEDALPNIADSFKRTTNPATRLAMATELFGKSGTKLIPILTQGREAVAAWTKEQQRLGAVVSKDSIGAVDDLGDSMGVLKKQLNAQSTTALATLSPVLISIVRNMQDWVAVNKDWIQTGVAEFAKDLGEWIKTIDFKKLASEVQGFLAGIGKFVDFVGGAKNALMGLVLFMNIQTIMALGSLVAALARAGLAFLGMAAKAYFASNASILGMARVAVVAIATAGPIGAIGAAFAWVAGIAAGAGGIISGAMGVVAVAIRGVGVALMANPLGLILGLATAAFLIYQNWGTLKEWFSSFFSWIGDKFKAVIGWAVDLAKTAGSFLGFGSSSPSGAAGSATTSAALATAAQPEARPATFNNRTPKPLWINPNADRPSLLAPQSKGRVDGQVNININGLPPGSRVEQVASGGDMPLNLNAGIRSYATGMPY